MREHRRKLMAVAVIMPRQGNTVESCIITKWNKKKGDTVAVGDILFSYETDKAAFDEEAKEAGTMLEVFFNEGDDVPCLPNVCVIGNPGESVDAFRPTEAGEAAPADWPLTLARVYEFATTAPLEEISFILEAARMNRQVAEEGLSSQYGLGVGKSMDARVRKHILSDDLPTFAIRLTAAAADARMAGVMMPVMSNSGSGNQGITCTMPVVACAIRQESSNEDLARALMMSHLTSIHIKHHLGRLSAHCGAMVAATAAGCGIALLLDGDLAVMERTIRNLVGNVAGMICDGDKSSCALKVATAVGAGIQAVMLALDGSVVPGNEGITDDDIEVCIANLGRLGSTGMKEADKVILDIMLKKS